MDGLRWLLLLFGALVVAGVYWYSRRQKAAPPPADPVNRRVEPRIEGHAAEAPVESAVGDQPAADEGEEAVLVASDEAPASSDATEQKIVTLRIVGREKTGFAGDELILSMRGIGLRHGKFGIFHRYDGTDETKVIFSAASLIEPGSFDLKNIKEQEIPGISLFLVLPGPIDSVEAFDLMMTAARALSQSLNGELLDESGSTLSIQRERYLREEIIQFQHSNLVA